MKRALALFACLFSLHISAHGIKTLTVESGNLYPDHASYREGYLQVSKVHSLFYAQYGNPDGFPVIVLHGGPGAGCSEAWTKMFDPAFYRVIMFDQRASGRSIPLASMEENTPNDLVNDIECLRMHLGIDKWLVFGGSWGSTLALLYGEQHPDKVWGFVLRGIFTGSEKEYLHLIYGMRTVFPEAWEEMASTIPEAERDDLITAFHSRLMDPDPEVHLPVAHAFMRYDTLCGTLLPDPDLVDVQAADDAGALSVARAFIHYAANKFFLKTDQLLGRLNRINHLPAIIIQGRYDVICPPRNAYELYKLWPSAELRFISNGAHFSSERPIAIALKEALDYMKERFTEESKSPE